jgi:hypothetical protein
MAWSCRALTRANGRGTDRRSPSLIGVSVPVLVLFMTTVLASSPTVSTTRLLNLYAAGQTDAAVALAVAAGPDGFKLRDFERDATDWLRFGTSGDQDRRISTASAFALEAVRARGIAFPTLELPNRASIILWGRHLLSTGSRDHQFEENWLVASADVLRRLNLPDASRYLPTYLRAAEDEYPSDTALRLLDAQRRLDALPGLIRARVEGDVHDGVSVDTTTLRDAAAQLETVTSPEWARSEALLYLGAIALSVGNGDGVRSFVRESSLRPSEPCTGYLSTFLGARADEEDGRVTDAEREYRAALAIVPRAQSATTRLAIVLTLADRHHEAVSTIRDELSALEPATDPWVAFLAHGCDHWREMVEPLREKLSSAGRH